MSEPGRERSGREPAVAAGGRGVASADLGTMLREAGFDWLVPEWPAHDAVAAFSTTRRGGVSVDRYASLNLGAAGGDDAPAVAENRRRVQRFLPSPPVWLTQVHGVDVVDLGTGDVDAARRSAPLADAAITTAADIVLAVRTADCLPILFADSAGTAVGAAHAGWRGLAGGVLEATVRALEGRAVPRERLRVWIGPGIGPKAFEVGGDVRAAFCTADAAASAAFVPHRPGKWLADLPALARRRLAAQGVVDVHGGSLCTATDAARFYSFRRDGDTGRQATFIWLRRAAGRSRV